MTPLRVLGLPLALLCALLASPSAGASLPLADSPYAQVFSDRYLFAGQAAECTAWPALGTLASATLVASLPAYHPAASSGAWIVGATAAAPATPFLSWFDIASGNLTALNTQAAPNQDCSLIVAGPEEMAGTYTAVAVCRDISGAGGLSLLQLSCPQDPTDCIAYTTQADFDIDCSVAYGAAISSSQGTGSGTLFLGCDTGLHGVDIATGQVSDNLAGISEPVSAVTWSDSVQTLFAASATNLYIADYSAASSSGVGVRWRSEWVTALIDNPPTSLAFADADSTLWIGQTSGGGVTGGVTLAQLVTVGQEQHWQFRRLAGQVSSPGSDIGGLPFPNVTLLASLPSLTAAGGGDGSVWLGGPRGLMRFDPEAEDARDQWRVFSSARFMPQRDAVANVSSLAVLPAGEGLCTAVAITAKGLAVIRFEEYTLARKAELIQSIAPRHTKYGLIGDCTSSSFGNPEAGCTKSPDDNDGLWTSIFLASQVWRFAVTNDSDAADTAWESFDAMVHQQAATGVLGYPARSIALRTDFPTSPPWFLSPTEPLWQFKGDTSSDEITGHEFVHPLVAELLAQTPQEILLAQQTSLNITRNIVSNGFYLVGETGKHTKWGVWAPEFINDNSDWQEGRGPNSIQILSWLVSAYVTTANDSYAQALETLLSPANRYDSNLVNTKMIAVCDSNFSDDELEYMATFNFQHAYDDAQKKSSAMTADQRDRWQALSASLQAFMRVGLDAAQRYKVREQSPFYNSIYCYASGQVGEQARKRQAKEKKAERKAKKLGKSHPAAAAAPRGGRKQRGVGSAPEFDCTSLSEDSVWYLRRWPTEQINWPQFNSDRLDVLINTPAIGCRANLQSLTALPPDERDVHKWNQGPFQLDGGDGFYEEGPGPFLSAYWMMRYYQMLQ